MFDIEHMLHHKHHIAAPPAVRNTCPFCGESRYRAGTACRKCGVVTPTEKESRRYIPKHYRTEEHADAIEDSPEIIDSDDPDALPWEIIQ